MRRWLRAARLAGGGCVLAAGMLLAATNQGPTAMADDSAPIGTAVTPAGHNPTMPDGVQATSGIARVVNQDLSSRPRPARPRLSPLDWLGGAAIAAALALLVIVAHLRRRPGTIAD